MPSSVFTYLFLISFASFCIHSSNTECPLCIRHYAKCQAPAENKTHRLSVTMLLTVLRTFSKSPPTPTHLHLLLHLVRLILTTSHCYLLTVSPELVWPTRPPPASWILCILRARAGILYFFYLYLGGSALGTQWAPKKSFFTACLLDWKCLLPSWPGKWKDREVFVSLCNPGNKHQPGFQLIPITLAIKHHLNPG